MSRGVVLATSWQEFKEPLQRSGWILSDFGDLKTF